MRAFPRVILACAMLVLPAHSAIGEDGPPSFVVTERSAEDLAIEAALAKRQAWVFQETPLKEVRARLEKELGVNVVLDSVALDDSGLTPDEPISLNLRDAEARTALDLICRPFELTWLVHDGLLHITSPAEAENQLETRVYDVASVSPEFDADGVEQPFPGESLINLMTSTVEPASWTDVGGTGVIDTAHFGHARALTITQAYSTHQRIERLLGELARLRHDADARAAGQVAPVRPEDENLRRMLAALEVKQDWALDAMTLVELLGQMEAATGKEFVLDAQASQYFNHGQPCGLPNMRSMSARGVLELVLRRHVLDWTIIGDAFFVTTRDDSDCGQIIHAYDVHDLVTEAELNWDTLIHIIESRVEATTWTDVGGTGAIQEFETAQIKALVIAQTPQTHGKIARLLADLRTLRDRAPKPPAPAAAPEKSAPVESEGSSTTSSLHLEIVDAALAEQAFAIDLYRQLADDERQGNLLVSPYSAFEALGMVHAGARGKTAEELANVLRCGGLTPDTSPAAFGLLRRKVQAAAELSKMELRVANRLWGDDQFQIAPNFLNVIGKDYDSIAELVDFGKPEAAAELINAWTSEHTSGRINEIVDASDVGSAKFVLTNATYLKAKWAKPFQPGTTLSGQFTTPEGKRRVAMMHQQSRFLYGEFDGVQVLSKPYEGGRFSMMLVLPDARHKLAAIEDNLRPEQLRHWQAMSRDRLVELKVPKFRFESTLPLVDVLSELGVQSLFNFEQADLSGLCDEAIQQQIYIEQVRQKTFVEVNEEGTEAAAVTVVHGGAGGFAAGPVERPVKFHADRPFLFAIREESTGAILFLGRVNKPESTPEAK